MGVMNAIVLWYDGAKLKNWFREKFDKVLLDAPCSSEGAVRRSYGVLNTWSEKNIINLSRLQKRLIESAFEMLKPGGVLVYSTCTLDPRENEGVVCYLLNKYPNAKLEKVRVEGLKGRKGVTQWREYTFCEEVEKTLRIWPQDNDTEGFYIAKIVKE